MTVRWLYEMPAVGSILDVPGDQGRQVRITWTRSGHDFIGEEEQVTEYAVYRRVDGRATGTAQEVWSGGGPDRLYPPGDWDFVTSVPARCEDEYMVVAPTLVDSTAEGGTQYSVFFVSALTATPGVYFDSPPDSGYSVDNLAPSPPAGLLAEGDETFVNLTWDPSEDEDFDYYAVYRDTVEDFGFDTPIGYAIEPTFYDDSPPFAAEWWYRVTATDFSGNESDPSAAVGVTATGIDESVPTRFFLGRPVPNPFARTSTIEYWIPAGHEGAEAELGMYDAAGRLVRELVSNPETPGVHRAVWDGRDANGAEVSSGVYFCRMEAGSFQARRKVVIIR
jgi:hypothetical protein